MADEMKTEGMIRARDLSKALLDPLNHAMAAGERHAIKMGVPVEAILEMNMNHLCSVVAMIEPAPVREFLITKLCGEMAGLVSQHALAIRTTAGGVVLPSGAKMPELSVENTNG
jgi:phosphoribosylcarboxyaminoimidazole (NCAIR) mutase